MTTHQIDELKSQWLADPCWDIEDTEGFEEHAAELKTFREQKQKEWAEKSMAEDLAAAEKVGCAGNAALGAYIRSLDTQLDQLRVDYLGVCAAMADIRNSIRRSGRAD